MTRQKINLSSFLKLIFKLFYQLNAFPANEKLKLFASNQVPLLEILAAIPAAPSLTRSQHTLSHHDHIMADEASPKTRSATARVAKSVNDRAQVIL